MAVEAFSYDDIYDLMRTEKFGAELQKLSLQDLEKIKSYLSGKQKLLNQQVESTQIFSSKKRATIQIEIDNALRALKDLYEFRERKIINRAIFSVRGGAVVRDTTNLLKHEEEFYNSLLQIIPTHKDSFFKLLEPGAPSKDSEAVSENDADKAITSESKKEDPHKPNNINLVPVRFLEDVESFVAQDLKSYGPYLAGAKEAIPKTIANLLISKNKVELSEGDKKENEISKTSENVLPEVQEARTSSNQASEDQS